MIPSLSLCQVLILLLGGWWVYVWQPLEYMYHAIAHNDYTIINNTHILMHQFYSTTKMLLTTCKISLKSVLAIQKLQFELLLNLYMIVEIATYVCCMYTIVKNKFNIWTWLDLSTIMWLAQLVGNTVPFKLACNGRGSDQSWLVVGMNGMCSWTSLPVLHITTSSMQITWPWPQVDRLCNDMITLRQKETWT